MTYRAVVRHVRYWRGAIHKWSTVYQFVGTASAGLTTSDCQLVLNADNKMLYKTGPNAGGTFECAIYNQASGGVPVATYTAFDWTVPSGWLAGSTTAWSTTTNGLEAAAETALSVRWPAGLSSSGKPVTIRKWYHMVPVSAAAAGAVDVITADYTPLTTAATSINGVLGAKGLTLGASSGRIAGTSAGPDRYYGNHQMDRGRRRKTSASSAKAQADYQSILQIIEGKAAEGN